MIFNQKESRIKECIKYGIGSLVIVDDTNKDLNQYTEISHRLKQMILLLKESDIKTENATQIRLGKNNYLVVYVNPEAENNPYLFTIYRKNGENCISQWVYGSDILFMMNDDIYRKLAKDVELIASNKMTSKWNIIPDSDIVKFRNFSISYDDKFIQAITTQTAIIDREEGLDR